MVTTLPLHDHTLQRDGTTGGVPTAVHCRVSHHRLGLIRQVLTCAA